MAARSVVTSVAAAAIAFGATAAADPDCSQPQHAQRIINHCSSLAYQAADRRLTALVREVRAALRDSGDAGRLDASQAAWVAYRDAQCRLEAPPSRRGSMWSMLYTICARLLTEARTQELQHYLACDLRSDESACMDRR